MFIKLYTKYENTESPSICLPIDHIHCVEQEIGGDCYRLAVEQVEFGKPLVAWDLD